MIDPRPAPVRPRVFAEKARGIVLLDELVEEMAAAGDVATLIVSGRRGAGTTTALGHLQHVIGTRSRLEFIEAVESCGEKSSAMILFLDRSPRQAAASLKCELAGWDRDEWIEYLLAVHKDRCASVMRRLQQDPDVSLLEGNANLCCQVFDQLAADDSLPGVKSALRQIIDNHFPDSQVRAAVGRNFYRTMTTRSFARDDKTEVEPSLSVDQARLACIPAVQLLLASEAAWSQLQDSDPQEVRLRWWRELVVEVAPRVAQSPAIQEKLRSWLTSNYGENHSLAISLLHRAGLTWHPIPVRFFDSFFRQPLNLTFVYLDDADCSQMNFAKCSMQRGSFYRARFTGCDLRDVEAPRARFDFANLRQAVMTRFNGSMASFAGADLSHVQADSAVLTEAIFSSANLSDAQFKSAWFSGSDLRKAILHRACLKLAHFPNTKLDEADFTDADLEGANFRGMDLSVAVFNGARFRSANLKWCSLEGMELPDAEFAAAQLNEAIMTGSVMPRANFSRATLAYAKLAEIDWEQANLRAVDMAGATFHMGSSRSGLVGSSIPMEGSRTGFYTDELHEQDFKAPEEIRKANLRGADLTGASIDGVDFYLVDLRDAIYDADQEQHLRRTGAILSPRP